MDWKTEPLSGKYLLDSGLLFEINRSTLHLLGISLAVNKENQLILVDKREAPESLLYPKEKYEECYKKLKTFMVEFGDSQIDKRREKIGFGYQAK